MSLAPRLPWPSSPSLCLYALLSLHLSQPIWTSVVFPIPPFSFLCPGFPFIICPLGSVHNSQLSSILYRFFIFQRLLLASSSFSPAHLFDAVHNPALACLCSRGGGVIWRIRPVAGLLLCQSNRQGSIWTRAQSKSLPPRLPARATELAPHALFHLSSCLILFSLHACTILRLHVFFSLV